MHIPASMLNGAVCPVTIAVGGAGVALTALRACKSKEKPSSSRFAAVTALIFALQMLNYPVQNGTSGHLVGAVLAVSLLGIPFAILSMSVILAVQALFFGDGGINAIGANIINMALVGAGLAGWSLRRLTEKGFNEKMALVLVSVSSVITAAAACAIEVSWSGAAAFNKIMPAMLSVHALIGIGEAVLTVTIAYALKSFGRFWRENETSVALGSAALAVLAAGLSPFTSSFPDGLEWVAGKFSFAQFKNLEMPAVFADYQAAFIPNAGLATIAAALTGIGIVFGISFLAGQLLNKRGVRAHVDF